MAVSLQLPHKREGNLNPKQAAHVQCRKWNVMNSVNKPEVSKSTALMYGVIVVFLAAMGVSFAFAAFLTPMGTAGIAASLLVVGIEAVMVLLLRSIYRTRYILTDKELVINTSKLIGGSKTIPLKTIDSVEATPIPLRHQTVRRQLPRRILPCSKHWQNISGYNQLPRRTLNTQQKQKLHYNPKEQIGIQRSHRNKTEDLVFLFFVVLAV